MTRLLLDTHALLWRERRGSSATIRARSAIDRVGALVYLSRAFWEIALKLSVAALTWSCQEIGIKSWWQNCVRLARCVWTFDPRTVVDCRTCRGITKTRSIGCSSHKRRLKRSLLLLPISGSNNTVWWW